MSTGAGPIVETVSRKRLVTPAELAQENAGRKTPEFWEFIEKMTPQMWGDDFTLYILREDPKPSLYGGTNTLEKCPGYIAMPDGTKQPLSSREDIELAIKQKYGGKAFRLILKRANGERICEGKCINEAAPKYPSDMTNPLPHSAATDASVATRAIDAMASQQPDALRLSMEVLRSASEIVMRHNSQPSAPPQTMDSELDRAFKAAMIQKLLAPQPDPIDTFLKIKQALGDTGGGMGGGPVMERILNAAVEKILNPVPAVSGRTTLLDIGREFIPVLGTVMHEYRLSREADMRITEIQRSAMPAAQPAPTVAQPNPQPPAAALPAPQPVTQPAAAPTMTFPQIEAHIASIISNSGFTTDEAVDEVLAFLYNTDPRLVGLLLNPPSLDSRLKPGKEGLMMLCTYEAPFKACLSNVPRLSEFLDKFIVAATEEETNQAKLRAAAPASPKPS